MIQLHCSELSAEAEASLLFPYSADYIYGGPSRVKVKTKYCAKSVDDAKYTHLRRLQTVSTRMVCDGESTAVCATPPREPMCRALSLQTRQMSLLQNSVPNSRIALSPAFIHSTRCQLPVDFE